MKEKKENIFKEEEKILKNTLDFIEQLGDDDTVSKEKYCELAEQYHDLLRLASHMNKVADLMTNGLNNVKLNLEKRVNIDELTGLYNRRHLIDSMDKYIKDTMRNKSYMSVLFIDVDCFKKYNDRYGHVQGDICLRKVAEALLKSTLRAFDFVARYGGEEFFVILPFVDEEGAVTVAERILRNVRAMGIEHLDNTADNIVTVSIGITSCQMDGESRITMDDFVKTSDAAMYASKTGGRNRYTYFDIKKNSL